MRCDITETDVNSIFLIQIRRLKSTTVSGSEAGHWDTLVKMELGKTETPTLSPDIAAVAGTYDYVAGGSRDSTTPANTYLTLSMNMEKLVCGDARAYRCELSYKSSTTDAVISAKRSSTFSAYVKPQVTSLITKKNGFIMEGMSPSNMVTTEVGDELQLTCTANIGSFSQTIIRWHRTSETSTSDDFIGYQPPKGTVDEGTATSDNQCGYIRVASIKYNVTVTDALRDNNLAFECFVKVSGDPYGKSYTSGNNPRLYIDVIKPCNAKTISDIGAAGTDVSLAVLVGAIFSALVVGFLLGMAFRHFYQRLKRTVIGHKTQAQHQQNQLQETEINVVTLPTNTYEQLRNRTDMESRMTYDTLNVNHNMRM
ncbi:uncharacterized protein LOC132725167 [Ruditapes philippinarum]|uniref:uncharacterized protein LOC132725167 n=1 Tax=Ruditapes philippinarum TaxID=129788 RepID=UPI00295A6FAA|nr:uncharacterized protein LOC132725167 [Ruditapes philippinarum]